MSFDKNEFLSKISVVFKENGLGSMLSMEKAKAFLSLTEIMLEENEKYNLTAITEPDKIIVNHYLDCAFLAKEIKCGASVVDVGCGAGFPTLPMAILRPDIKILGVDSTAKRVNYVQAAAEALGLENVTTLTARAEEAGTNPEMREKYDYAVARAVAAMPILSELCLPLVKVGGKFIAMKGKNAKFELQDAKRAIPTLGGKLVCCNDVIIKGGDEELCHPLIVIDKVLKTPAAYPRPYAKILKKPL